MSWQDDTTCADCGVETLPLDERRAEFYTATDEVWSAGGAGEGLLCIGCLEARLGRRLVATDFTSAPINDLGRADMDRYAWSWRTPRLTDRLKTQPREGDST